MPEFDVLVAGEINPDLVLTGANLEPRFGQVEVLADEASLTIGSSSAIFACGVARLGLKVALIGVIGEDLFGEFMLAALAEQGVDVSAVIRDPHEHTGFSVILNRLADRAIITYPGAIGALRAEQVSDEVLHRARHLHVASYFLQTALQPGLKDLFLRARSLGLTISLDTNWDPQEQWHGLDEILPLVDVFLPNEAEALSLTKAASLEEAMIALLRYGLIVAVKRGEKGAMTCQENRVIVASALPVQVVDTIGAGDSFDAGFVFGYLNDWDLERSLALATICGSLSTRARGGTQGQPTLSEAQDFLKNYL